jgi:hypothetical protein
VGDRLRGVVEAASKVFRFDEPVNDCDCSSCRLHAAEKRMIAALATLEDEHE